MEKSIARAFGDYVKSPTKMVAGNIPKIMRNLEKLTASNRQMVLGLLQLHRAHSQRR